MAFVAFPIISLLCFSASLLLWDHFLRASPKQATLAKVVQDEGVEGDGGGGEEVGAAASCEVVFEAEAVGVQVFLVFFDQGLGDADLGLVVVFHVAEFEVALKVG